MAVTRLVLPPPKLTPAHGTPVSTPEVREAAPTPAQTPVGTVPTLSSPAAESQPATAQTLAGVDSLGHRGEPSAAADLPLLEEFVADGASTQPVRQQPAPAAVNIEEPAPRAETVPAIGATALHVAEALEQVAQRLRRGELTLAPHMVPSEEAALSVALAALLGARG